MAEFSVQLPFYKNAKKHCIVRRLNYEDIDKALHLWFLQQRAVGMPISGSLLQTKVKLFYSHFHPDESKFKTSKGYLQRFKDRYGIRNLTLKGRVSWLEQKRYSLLKIGLMNTNWIRD